MKDEEQAKEEDKEQSKKQTEAERQSEVVPARQYHVRDAIDAAKAIQATSASITSLDSYTHQPCLSPRKPLSVIAHPLHEWLSHRCCSTQAHPDTS